MIRHFDPCQVHYGEKYVRGVKLTCGKCSTSISLPMNTIMHP